jgi:hypothetical protein
MLIAIVIMTSTGRISFRSNRSIVAHLVAASGLKYTPRHVENNAHAWMDNGLSDVDFYEIVGLLR